MTDSDHEPTQPPGNPDNQHSAGTPEHVQQSPAPPTTSNDHTNMLFVGIIV